MKPEVLVPGQAQLGEGPSWDANARRLTWVDILSYRLFVLEDGRTNSFEFGDYISAAVPTEDSDRLLIALGTGVSLLDLASGEVEQVAFTGADPETVRVNDAKVDPAGNLWVGTMSLDDEPNRGALYRLDLDRTLHKALDGVSISNGPAWSPAGDTMYYVDSPTESIVRFSFDPVASELLTQEQLVDATSLTGIPDGMTVDAAGNLWVAFWDGGCVRCFSPEGELLDTVEMPVSRPTSCAFGGAGLELMYITSARCWLAPEALATQPLAGSLFVVEPGPRGLAQPRAKIPG